MKIQHINLKQLYGNSHKLKKMVWTWVDLRLLKHSVHSCWCQHLLRCLGYSDGSMNIGVFNEFFLNEWISFFKQLREASLHWQEAIPLTNDFRSVLLWTKGKDKRTLVSLSSLMKPGSRVTSTCLKQMDDGLRGRRWKYWQLELILEDLLTGSNFKRKLPITSLTEHQATERHTDAYTSLWFSSVNIAVQLTKRWSMLGAWGGNRWGDRPLLSHLDRGSVAWTQSQCSSQYATMKLEIQLRCITPIYLHLCTCRNSNNVGDAWKENI